MIARLRGRLAEKEPTRVVLDCQGIGFEVHVPLSTSRQLSSAGSEAELLIVTRFPRVGVELYGFATKPEQDVFRLITSVHGVGPKLGMNLLSRFSPGEIMQTIAAGRLDVMRSVPGIGPKKAQKILDELRERTEPVREAEPILDDAVAALVSLGLTRREARGRVAGIESAADLTLEQILRQALKQG